MSWKDIIKQGARRRNQTPSRGRQHGEIQLDSESQHRTNQMMLLRRLDAIVQVADSTIKGLGDTDKAIGLSEDEIEKRMMEIIEIATGKR